ncbi:MAG: hypothetical protein PUB57_08265 [Selenomonadaceae bacterium]|nr:hypothetical protein [Selenomonadaceae bacterium]
MEDKRRERFLRLAPARVQKIINQLQILGNCANTSNYAYTDEEIKKIFDAIRQEVDSTEQKFLHDAKKRIPFKL